jgi:DNA gyrase subunit A
VTLIRTAEDEKIVALQRIEEMDDLPVYEEDEVIGSETAALNPETAVDEPEED